MGGYKIEGYLPEYVLFDTRMILKMIQQHQVLRKL